MNERCCRVLTVASLAVLAGALLAMPPRASEDESARVHARAEQIQEAALAVFRAVLREDAAAARKGLDEVEKSCRRLDPEEVSRFGPKIVHADQAFHMALDRARESAGPKDVAPAFDNFIWVVRTCHECHGVARERGLLPAEGPLP